MKQLITVLAALLVVESSGQLPKHRKQPVRRIERREHGAGSKSAAEETLKKSDALSLMDPVFLRGRADPALAQAWAALADETLHYIPFETENIRAVAEIRTPETSDERQNQFKELAYFRSEGYNTILAVWYGEPVSKLVAVLRQCRHSGWRVVVAYGQPEDRPDPYRNVQHMQQNLTRLLEYADGFCPTWRGTSASHGNSEQRLAYIRQVASLARAARADIPVVQELFWTGAGFLPEKLLDCAGAAMLFNVGYDGANAEAVAAAARKHAGRAVQLAVLIIGTHDYYASYKPAHQSPRQTMFDKQRLEQRFRRAEIGTVTLLGDGSDGRVPGTDTHDSATQTEWRNR